MLRRIGGVLLGFVVMGMTVLLVQFLAGTLGGDEFVFQPGSFEPSVVWQLINIVTGLAAALIGGVVCQKLAGCKKSVTVLAVLVFVLGIVSAVWELGRTRSDPPVARTKGVTQDDLAKNVFTPAWIAISYPFIGAIGVLVGGKLVRGRTVQ